MKTIVVSDYHFKTQNEASDGAHIGPNTLGKPPYSFKYIFMRNGATDHIKSNKIYRKESRVIHCT